MCFSASASFGGGAVLAVTGIITLAKTKQPLQWAFASIPLLFSIQQLTEGFLWLALMHPQYAHWQTVPLYLFFFFSHVLWPVWIPFSLVLPEKKLLRKRILYFILGLAVILSASEIYCLFTYRPIAVINGHHIEYRVYFPKKYIAVTNVLYLPAAVLPCFISSVKKMWLFALALLVSLIVSALFFEKYLISVWCFFAALLSIVIYLILSQSQSNDFFRLLRKKIGNFGTNSQHERNGL